MHKIITVIINKNMAVNGRRCDDRTIFLFFSPQIIFPSRNELLILRSTRFTFK